MALGTKLIGSFQYNLFIKNDSVFVRVTMYTPWEYSPALAADCQDTLSSVEFPLKESPSYWEILLFVLPNFRFKYNSVSYRSLHTYCIENGNTCHNLWVTSVSNQLKTICNQFLTLNKFAIWCVIRGRCRNSKQDSHLTCNSDEWARQGKARQKSHRSVLQIHVPADAFHCFKLKCFKNNWRKRGKELLAPPLTLHQVTSVLAVLEREGDAACLFLRTLSNSDKMWNCN